MSSRTARAWIAEWSLGMWREIALSSSIISWIKAGHPLAVLFMKTSGYFRDGALKEGNCGQRLGDYDPWRTDLYKCVRQTRQFTCNTYTNTCLLVCERLPCDRRLFKVVIRVCLRWVACTFRSTASRASLPDAHTLSGFTNYVHVRTHVYGGYWMAGLRWMCFHTRVISKGTD